MIINFKDITHKKGRIEFVPENFADCQTLNTLAFLIQCNRIGFHNAGINDNRAGIEGFVAISIDRKTTEKIQEEHLLGKEQDTHDSQVDDKKHNRQDRSC